MSVFGFIENFFFISLALVFVLVILLVYHFKTRITVAEKKSESMYGLLTAVVKEIKTLRGMFSLGGINDVSSSANIQSAEPVSTSRLDVGQFKSEDASLGLLTGFTRETNSDGDSRQQDEFPIENSENNTSSSIKSNNVFIGDMNDNLSHNVNHLSFASVQNVEMSCPNNGNSLFSGIVENVAALEQCEPITLEFAATENKIVVSDDSDSEDDLSGSDDSNTESDSESEPDSDLESEPESEHEIELSETPVFKFESHDFRDIEILNINELELNSELNDQSQLVESEHVESLVEENVSVPFAESSTVLEPINETANEHNDSVNAESLDVTSEQPREVDDIRTNNNNDQFKKMNITQLKNIASQIGIVHDVSKMKKHELIALIRESNSNNI